MGCPGEPAGFLGFEATRMGRAWQVETGFGTGDKADSAGAMADGEGGSQRISISNVQQGISNVQWRRGGIEGRSGPDGSGLRGDKDGPRMGA